MGSAIYPEFERKIEGYDPSTVISGKPLARSMDELDKICVPLGVPGLWSFYSESNTEAFAKIGEPLPPDMVDDPIAWSEPADGLRTIEALTTHLRSHAEELPGTPRILEDLDALGKVLLKARQHSTRFRLRIDV